ncbi:MAG: hypothetical protein MJ238_03300 [Bacilli bacterium]|nr:hypothetical protein [Bacilli bacterium]
MKSRKYSFLKFSLLLSLCSCSYKSFDVLIAEQYEFQQSSLTFFLDGRCYGANGVELRNVLTENDAASAFPNLIKGEKAHYSLADNLYYVTRKGDGVYDLSVYSYSADAHTTISSFESAENPYFVETSAEVVLLIADSKMYLCNKDKQPSVIEGHYVGNNETSIIYRDSGNFIDSTTGGILCQSVEYDQYLPNIFGEDVFYFASTRDGEFFSINHSGIKTDFTVLGKQLKLFNNNIDYEPSSVFVRIEDNSVVVSQGKEDKVSIEHPGLKGSSIEDATYLSDLSVFRLKCRTSEGNEMTLCFDKNGDLKLMDPLGELPGTFEYNLYSNDNFRLFITGKKELNNPLVPLWSGYKTSYYLLKEDLLENKTTIISNLKDSMPNYKLGTCFDFVA